MTEIRGRHFAFLAILCAAWTAGRVGIIALQPTPVADARESQQHFNATSPVAYYKVPTDILHEVRPNQKCCIAGANRFAVLRRTPRLPVHGLPQPAAKLADATGRYGPFVDAIYIRPQRLTPSPVAIKETRKLTAEYYAYSFWRIGGTSGGLASGGQYGGSQSGAIATFSLQKAGEKFRPQHLAILVRAAMSHRNPEERELATGIRWRPLQNLPMTITGERRFRNGRPGAFAIYAAGGASDVSLPLKFRLDSFGQAGMVSGKGGGPFFDIIARADRKVGGGTDAAIHAGAGIWAGGQRDIKRVDAGPSLRSDIAIKRVSFRLTADWRFRVAGNAKPGNGPAITLSTSF